VYDPDIIIDKTTTDVNKNHKFTTSFGHQIKIESNITQISSGVLVPDAIPQRVDELCCMMQIYDKVRSINLYTIHERESITANYPIIRVGANLHQGLDLDTSLAEDEKILTSLTLGQITDEALM
jgi:hypothetical protein